jgi:(S)-ureidoglycine aminohydrolase
MTLNLNNLPRILPQGTTRSRVTNRYALITPDTFVPSTLPAPHWTNTRGIIQISPQMGADFLQYEAHLTAESIGHPINTQRFLFVIEGQLHLHLGKGKKTLRPGGFAYLPVNTDYQLRAPKHARLLIIEKTYSRLPGTNTPDFIVSHESDHKPAPFLGDDALQLKLLLPDIPAMDMAVNIFEYAPGGTLPQVEIHLMEHGLMMLDGAGIYRLGADWHPVQAGDIIWMAPYCEQWFVAMGKKSARYIYYKNINRHPGAGTP